MADNEVEQIIEERYAVNPNILSNWGDSNDDSRETQFLEQAEEMEENMKNKESKDIPGYLSNEIYEPIKIYEDKIERENNKDEDKNIMNLSINEIIENTSQCLNDFEADFLMMLYKVDLEHGTSRDEKGLIKNLKRYFIALMMYLNDKNNILYIGVTLFIISIIIYFISIIRNDKLPQSKSKG